MEHLESILTNVNSQLFTWQRWLRPKSWVATVSTARGSVNTIYVMIDAVSCAQVVVRDAADGVDVVEFVDRVCAIPKVSWSQKAGAIQSHALRLRRFGVAFSYRSDLIAPDLVAGVPQIAHACTRFFPGWLCELRADDSVDVLRFALNKSIRAADFARTPGPRLEWKASFERTSTNGKWQLIDWPFLVRMFTVGPSLGQALFRTWNGREVLVRCLSERIVVGDAEIARSDASATLAGLNLLWIEVVDPVAYQVVPHAPV